MNSAYIYHHLGLGDHIIANGMVRTLAKKYEKTYIFCKSQNIRNVSFMYRDLSNLGILEMDDDIVKNFMRLNPQNSYIIAGHGPFETIYRNPQNTLCIDEIFYKLAGVPIENKRLEFFVQRDLDREKKLFNQLGLGEGERFAFVHDSDKRKIYKNIPDIKIVKPLDMEWTIFDFLYTIEKAEEIHCVNSSFFCLIDCLNSIKKEKMFLHKYAIPNTTEKLLGKLKDEWIILE